MGKNKKKYTRLPGTGASWVSRHNLWAADDHLLLVTTTFAAEDYLHFSYSDIQGIVIQRTSRGTVRTVLFALLAAIPLALYAMALSREDLTQTWVWGILSVPAVLSLIASILLGPTCEVRLRTASGVHPLPSLHRLCSARRALARIRALVEGAQGPLTREAVRERSASFAPAPPSASFPAMFAADDGHKAYDGSTHRLYFRFVLGMCLTSPVFIYWHGIASVLLSLVIFVAGFVLLTMCLARQDRRNTPALTRGVTWSFLGTTILSVLVTYGYAGYLFFSRALESAASGLTPEPPSLKILDDPFLMVYFIAGTAIEALLAAAGLISLGKGAGAGRTGARR